MHRWSSLLGQGLGGDMQQVLDCGGHGSASMPGWAPLRQRVLGASVRSYESYPRCWICPVAFRGPAVILMLDSSPDVHHIVGRAGCLRSQYTQCWMYLTPHHSSLGLQLLCVLLCSRTWLFDAPRQRASGGVETSGHPSDSASHWICLSLLPTSVGISLQTESS